MTRLVESHCIQCGKPIVAYPSQKRVFCSQACHYQHRTGTTRVPLSVCGWCGRQFKSVTTTSKPMGKRTRTRFCSRKCSAMARYDGKHPSMEPPMRRTYLHSYRSRQRDAFVEVVPFDYIYQRDRGVCQICGQRCSVKEASLDHILPISRGGTHEKRNVQLAHKRCNSIKLNTGVGRLRLIG